MVDTLQALEATQVGTLVRESLYGFPILVGLHILGLTLSVGMLMWFDLRLLGVALTSAPVTRVYRRLIPWATVGFVVMVVTGALLFIGYATSAWGQSVLPGEAGRPRTRGAERVGVSPLDRAWSRRVGRRAHTAAYGASCRAQCRCSPGRW